MKTIVWDVDDVLNDLMRVWLETWRVAHPSCVAYKDLTRNPPDSALGIAKEEYLESLDFFRQSRAYREMSPVADVKEWFVLNGGKFRHSALTAAPLRAASASASWTFTHFGEWIRTFHFVPSKRNGEKIVEYDRNKAEFLRRQSDVDLFVDDNAENVAGARQAGINALLFPRPWNGSNMPVSELLARVAAL